MVIDSNAIIIAIIASILSGAGTAIIAILNENKKEKIRQNEKARDDLRSDLKDLQIKLYQLEKDLTYWKDKYYSTIQELIAVRSELEEAVINLSLIHLAHEE
jgi:uncharacterized protein (DUF3084 family)